MAHLRVAQVYDGHTRPAFPFFMLEMALWIPISLSVLVRYTLLLAQNCQ